MATKFQIDYLVGVVKDELKKQETALIEEHRAAIDLNVNLFIDAHQIQEGLFASMRQYYLNEEERKRLENENDRLLMEMNTFADGIWQNGNRDLVPTKYNHDLDDRPAKERFDHRVEVISGVIEKRLLPDLLEKFGVKERIVVLHEQGKDLTHKITLALNMASLRKAIVEVNAFLGLNLSV